jgi:hypothetical protein
MMVCIKDSKYLQIFILGTLIFKLFFIFMYTKEKFDDLLGGVRRMPDLPLNFAEFANFTEEYVNSLEVRNLHMGNRIVQERQETSARREETSARLEETSARLAESTSEREEITNQLDKVKDSLAEVNHKLGLSKFKNAVLQVIRKNYDERRKNDDERAAKLLKELSARELNGFKVSVAREEEARLLHENVHLLSRKEELMEIELSELHVRIQALTPERISISTQTDPILAPPSTFIGMNATQWSSFSCGIACSAALMEVSGHAFGHQIRPYSFLLGKTKQGVKKVKKLCRKSCRDQSVSVDALRPEMPQSHDFHAHVEVMPVPVVPVVHVHS